jgi:two-component system cell cycle sensor histidine kinase PleC
MNAERARRFDARAKRAAVRVIGKIVGTALLLAVCMWAFIAWSLWSEYRAANERGRIEGYNLTAAFASELTMTFDSISAALRVIDNNVKDAPPDTHEAARLREAIGAVAGPNIDVTVAGPDGRLVFSTLHPDPGPLDFSQRRHFIAHRDNPIAPPPNATLPDTTLPDTGLIVDPPPAGTAGKTIEVSRRLETADGRFAGEAMLLLQPGSLFTLNHEIDLGRRGMIVVAGTDGIVRAGFDRDHPDGLVGVGTDLRGAPYPAQLEPGGTAVYRRISRVDSVDRLITIRSLERYPLRVLVGLDLDDVLGPARAHIRLIALVGFGASAILAILTALLLREVWRRTNREIELAYDRDRLILAQAQIEADRARLAEANLELQASKESADAANQARSQFLAHMSHELRTPLHAIIGFSELIQDQAPARPGSPPIAGYAADIWSSGRHLLELINTILDISKVESGTATLTESVFPVADLARSSLVHVRAQAEASNIAIDLRVPDCLVRIRADRTRLLQVLVNLLSNAVKFTPHNGRIVLCVTESETGQPVFSVADTGIGMTQAEIEIALEPFGQVDNTFSRSFEGTGLGLPLARKLVELHGGRLELTSVKGKGTTAKVILPAERAQQRDGARIGGGVP